MSCNVGAPSSQPLFVFSKVHILLVGILQNCPLHTPIDALDMGVFRAARACTKVRALTARNTRVVGRVLHMLQSVAVVHDVHTHESFAVHLHEGGGTDRG